MNDEHGETKLNRGNCVLNEVVLIINRWFEAGGGIIGWDILTGNYCFSGNCNVNSIVRPSFCGIDPSAFLTLKAERAFVGELI